MKPERILIAVAALAIGCTMACNRTEHKPAGAPEKVTIALASLPETALAQIAQSRGYYREEGLEATVHLHPYGKIALKELLEGKADFATVAETPVMFAIMNNEKISVIATIQTSTLGHAVLARRDRGVVAIKDLKGKRIAATVGTTSQFFLDTILITNGISRKDITVVDLKAEEIPGALARGDIDAASSFEPYSVLTQQKLGENLVTFKDKDIYKYTFNVVATQDFIRMNPGKVGKMVKALIKAEDFARKNPAEAQKVVSGFTRLDTNTLSEIWSNATFAATLDQTLILALEDESEWAIRNGLTKATKVPNYLDFIHVKALQSVKPEAVKILK